MNKQADLIRILSATVLLAVLCAGRLGFAAGDHSGQIITFDVPGAGTAANQGTIPFSNNLQGDITGYWVDNNGASHGFVRHFAGDLVSFDAPGSYLLTQGQGINNQGFIVGNYQDSNYVGWSARPTGRSPPLMRPEQGCNLISRRWGSPLTRLV